MGCRLAERFHRSMVAITTPGDEPVGNAFRRTRREGRGSLSEEVNPPQECQRVSPSECSAAAATLPFDLPRVTYRTGGAEPRFVRGNVERRAISTGLHRGGAACKKGDSELRSHRARDDTEKMPMYDDCRDRS